MLKRRFLCKSCNSQVGQLEAGIKESPEIRLAVERLKGEIPELHDQVSEGQEFTGVGHSGTIQLIHRDGRLRPRMSGVLQPDNERGLRNIMGMLAAAGLDPDQIQAVMLRIRKAPENEEIATAAGVSVVRRRWERVEVSLRSASTLVDLSGGPGHESLIGPGIGLLKIAFEYLALHAGNRVQERQFDAFRAALRESDPSLCNHRLEWVENRLAPMHQLSMCKPPTTGVRIRLFGALVYHLEFPAVQVGDIPRYRYSHNLQSGEEVWEQLRAPAHP